MPKTSREERGSFPFFFSLAKHKAQPLSISSRLIHFQFGVLLLLGVSISLSELGWALSWASPLLHQFLLWFDRLGQQFGIRLLSLLPPLPGLCHLLPQQETFCGAISVHLCICLFVHDSMDSQVCFSSVCVCIPSCPFPSLQTLQSP